MDKENKRRWHNMLIIAFSNHKIDHNEIEYLADISTRLDISFDELDKSINCILTGSCKLDTGITREEKIETLKDVVSVSVLDDRIDKDELSIIKKVSHAAGISDEELDEIIKSCKKTVSKDKGHPANFGL